MKRRSTCLLALLGCGGTILPVGSNEGSGTPAQSSGSSQVDGATSSPKTESLCAGGERVVAEVDDASAGHVTASVSHVVFSALEGVSQTGPTKPEGFEGVRAIDKVTSAVVRLASGRVSQLGADATHAFWYSWGDKVHRVPITGGTDVVIATVNNAGSPGARADLLVAKDRVYVTAASAVQAGQPEATVVESWNKDGSDPRAWQLGKPLFSASAPSLAAIADRVFVLRNELSRGIDELLPNGQALSILRVDQMGKAGACDRPEAFFGPMRRSEAGLTFLYDWCPGSALFTFDVTKSAAQPQSIISGEDLELSKYVVTGFAFGGNTLYATRQCTVCESPTGDLFDVTRRRTIALAPPAGWTQEPVDVAADDACVYVLTTLREGAGQKTQTATKTRLMAVPHRP